MLWKGDNQDDLQPDPAHSARPADEGPLLSEAQFFELCRDQLGEDANGVVILLQQKKLPAHIWQKAQVRGRIRWVRKWHRVPVELSIGQIRIARAGAFDQMAKAVREHERS